MELGPYLKHTDKKYKLHNYNITWLYDVIGRCIGRKIAVFTVMWNTQEKSLSLG